MGSIIVNSEKNINSYLHSTQSQVLQYILLLPALVFNRPITIWIPWVVFYGLYWWPLAPILLILISTLTLKKMTKLPRPEPLVPRIVDLRCRESNFTMPSGDSAQAACFFTIMYLAQHWNVFICLIGQLCVMCGRIVFQCHYLRDTIVGSILGFCLAYISFSNFYLNNQEERKFLEF